MPIFNFCGPTVASDSEEVRRPLQEKSDSSSYSFGAGVKAWKSCRSTSTANPAGPLGASEPVDHVVPVSAIETTPLTQLAQPTLSAELTKGWVPLHVDSASFEKQLPDLFGAGNSSDELDAEIHAMSAHSRNQIDLSFGSKKRNRNSPRVQGRQSPQAAVARQSPSAVPNSQFDRNIDGLDDFEHALATIEQSAPDGKRSVVGNGRWAPFKGICILPFPQSAEAIAQHGDRIGHTLDTWLKASTVHKYARQIMLMVRTIEPDYVRDMGRNVARKGSARQAFTAMKNERFSAFVSREGAEWTSDHVKQMTDSMLTIIGNMFAYCNENKVKPKRLRLDWYSQTKVTLLSYEKPHGDGALAHPRHPSAASGAISIIPYFTNKDGEVVDRTGKRGYRSFVGERFETLQSTRELDLITMVCEIKTSGGPAQVLLRQIFVSEIFRGHNDDEKCRDIFQVFDLVGEIESEIGVMTKNAKDLYKQDLRSVEFKLLPAQVRECGCEVCAPQYAEDDGEYEQNDGNEAAGPDGVEQNRDDPEEFYVQGFEQEAQIGSSVGQGEPVHDESVGVFGQRRNVVPVKSRQPLKARSGPRRVPFDL